MRAQHGDLFASICSIVDEGDELFRRHVSPEVFSDFGFRFLDFELQLQEHEAQENALIMQAFNDDIGVGD